MTFNNKEIFSENLQYYMNKHGVDRNALVDDLDFKYMTVSDWINKNTYPRIDKIEMLAHYFGIQKSDLIEEQTEEKRIESEIARSVKELDMYRKKKVKVFADDQLEEQRKVIDLNGYIEESMHGYLSAGTGEYLSEDIKESVRIPKSIVPSQRYDMVLQVNGDSMTPMFEDGEFVFVKRINEVEEIRSGQVGVFIIDGHSYLKKAYVHDDHLRLVSLNKEYPDLKFDSRNDIKPVGIVVL